MEPNMLEEITVGAFVFRIYAESATAFTVERFYANTGKTRVRLYDTESEARTSCNDEVRSLRKLLGVSDGY